MRTVFALAFALVLAACAKPLAPLPGTVTEAEIQVPEGEDPVLIDWVGAVRVAGQDGYAYKRRPLASTKPTREEIEATNKVESENEDYAVYVSQPAILKRAQDAVLPELEAQLVAVPKAPFFQGRVPVLNGPGPDLKLILKPRPSTISPRDTSQMSAGRATASVAAALLLGAAPTMPLDADYQLLNAETGDVVRTGSIRGPLRQNPRNGLVPYQEYMALITWLRIAQQIGAE